MYTLPDPCTKILRPSITHVHVHATPDTCTKILGPSITRVCHTRYLY